MKRVYDSFDSFDSWIFFEEDLNSDLLVALDSDEKDIFKWIDNAFKSLPEKKNSINYFQDLEEGMDNFRYVFF